VAAKISSISGVIELHAANEAGKKSSKIAAGPM
jgi:hypothetical protein